MEGENGIDMNTESGFEPLARVRSNTWPLPRPDGYIDGAVVDSATVTVTVTGDSSESATNESCTSKNSEAGSSLLKKKLPRRKNAWGTLSYAELITQAISSAKEQRLTLAQIYEWMVKNVPYFKDKGESNSSAGWKNSIRHNLSLHSCFTRVHNEGSGKSSWWMLNSEAKLRKTTRRRAASMEAGQLEKSRLRARAKKQAKTSPNGSTLHHIALRTSAFRARASSSASSCARLSPIPAAADELESSHEPAIPVEQTAIQAPSLCQINYISALDHFSSEKPRSLANHSQTNSVQHQLTPGQFCPALDELDESGCHSSLLELQPANAAASSYLHCAPHQYDPYFQPAHANQYLMTTSPKTLMPIQEMTDFRLLESQMESQPMVRSNSMLDDIDEIIRREQQYLTLDFVNNSLSSELYISNNNSTNAVTQHSWVHS